MLPDCAEILPLFQWMLRAILLSYWANFDWCKSPNIEQISCHLNTWAFQDWSQLFTKMNPVLLDFVEGTCIIFGIPTSILGHRSIERVKRRKIYSRWVKNSIWRKKSYICTTSELNIPSNFICILFTGWHNICHIPKTVYYLSQLITDRFRPSKPKLWPCIKHLSGHTAWAT